MTIAIQPREVHNDPSPHPEHGGTEAPETAPLADIRLSDLPEFGGKNASLGELMHELSASGVRVPGGFATSATAFRRHMRESGLSEKIASILEGLDVDDVRALAEAGKSIRELVESTPLEKRPTAAMETAFRDAVDDAENVSWAVRSSATAEDLPEASFAGQQETFLNVRGIDAVLDATRRVFASLFTDRAIAYRVRHGFLHEEVAISVGVQRMVRSDLGSSGVMFTMDTESGFDRAVFITSAFGLGEDVVPGAVNPDEFYVSKRAIEAGKSAILRRTVGSKATKMVFTTDRHVGRTVEFVGVPADERRRLSLSDEQAVELATLGLAIEKHYGRPMDIEWGLDGETNELFILQARPETVQSRASAAVIERHRMLEHTRVLIEGRAIGSRIGAGRVRVLTDLSQMASFEPGDVLVADMTDPDWEPIMKRASAIVTNRGGRTCHAAIIARELGIPAVVGTATATEVLSDGDEVTVSCAEGDEGHVYEGSPRFDVETIELESLPETDVTIMMNVGAPEQAFALSRIPNAGVGLARLEFIIGREIGVHPRAILEPSKVDEGTRDEITRRSAAYPDARSFYIERLAEGIATIAEAFYPEPVIVRTSDFKSNEYAQLVGGGTFEPEEENPMIGFRGAARYLSDVFRPCYDMECEALRIVREDMGLTNVQIMLPFVRTLDEADGVLAILEANGLRRGEHDLRVVMMCEVPSNAILVDDFLERVDGFSIGSNDLTQLTLGLDRDSAIVADAFDDRGPAVRALIEKVVRTCRARDKFVGICGQGPSDHPEFAEWLQEIGISSLSLNPDTVVDTRMRLGAAR